MSNVVPIRKADLPKPPTSYTCAECGGEATATGERKCGHATAGIIAHLSATARGKGSM